ncbi:hypothetical protein U27_05439 [Candidatus Vecturithrix granuli]|uniref:PA14 domain-containing protein n=1 Tax=Vecturithrix granuli TaxID=1499967 RepID=A0A081C1L0_VECG1|nr:hypothetical protein U27_05439 [Candidatus Vecturithrix granuli]
MNTRRSHIIHIFILIAYFLTLTEIIILALCRPDFHGVQGTYYANEQWQGDPGAVRLDQTISRDALRVFRDTQAQNQFSVEWKGYLHIPETGVYKFLTNSDDGSWLFIDDNLVVDNGGAHGLQKAEGKIHLIQGLHQIKVRYFQIGGYAILDLAWAQEPLPYTALDSKFLLPPDTSTPQFWMYQQARRLIPFFGVLWGILIVWIGVSTYLTLRQAENRRFERYMSSRSLFGTWLSQTMRSLCVEPVLFAVHHLKRPVVYRWLLVAVYSAIIFLTLSYARTLSSLMETRYGKDVFSQITSVTLTAAGIGVLAYFLTRKTHLLARLSIFALIAAVYGFILNPDLRNAVCAYLQTLGMNTHFLESLDIYPIVAAEKIHFLEYGLLGLLLCKTLSYQIKNKSAYLVALVIVYLVGMTDETLQWALPNRVGEYRDIWINVVSGALAILAVWLVIRPRVFQQPFQWAALRPLCYTLAAALLYTGLFLEAAHGFGSRIFMPDNGVELTSRFSEYDLLQLDKRLVQRQKRILAEDSSNNDLWTYSYEARRHHYLRDKYYNSLQYFESYCEQEILKTYFRAYLGKANLVFFDYEPESFNVFPHPDQHIFYTSAAQELAVMKFLQRRFWIITGISVAFLCFLATFLPGTRRSGTSAPRNIERLVLRPIFGMAVLFVIILSAFTGRKTSEFTHTNLLILTVDSCQPDYWGAYGYEKNTTPFFDSLAPDGMLFTNAIAPGSWTIPSLASLLTGLNPNVHGIEARGQLMDRRIPTLFEMLEQQGYIIGDASYILTEPSINSVFKKENISDEVALSEGRSEESYLLSWMQEHKEQPFFAWVHFHTSHLPYRAAPPYNQMFLEDVDPDVLQDQQIEFVRSNIIVRKGEVEFDPQRHTEAVRALYTQTLRQQDAKIGKVLQRLEELGLKENTLIVITADHGDELLEHGFVGHASTSWDASVYDDLINVPLLLYYPKVFPAGKRIDTQVRVIDILPTVLDALNIPLTAKIQGQSLLPLIRGDSDFHEEFAFSETTPCGYSCPKRLENHRRRSVRSNEWKLIANYNPDENDTRYELYHLAEDPGETKNVLDEYPEIVDQFKQEMQRWMDAPQQFAYHVEKTEEEHYLDVDVEVRPIVIFPKVGTVLSPDTYNQRVLVQWIGQENADYIIEYEVGTGGYHITGELEVVGTEQWFGPFPEDIWQALPLYNPWKFRVIPRKYPEYPSEWITFEMKNK